ncbi:hypothetical protein SK128_004701, partial [Halocaridina rubra]
MAHISLTPPQTPPLGNFNGGNEMDSDSLDYMDFFSADLEPSPAKNAIDGDAGDIGLILFSCKGEARWNETLSDTSCIGKKSLAYLLQNKCPTQPTFITPDVVFHLPCSADNISFHLDHYFSSV